MGVVLAWGWSVFSISVFHLGNEAGLISGLTTPASRRGVQSVSRVNLQCRVCHDRPDLRYYHHVSLLKGVRAK